jgi:N-acetylmuramoyl-L-alanine amidase
MKITRINSPCFSKRTRKLSKIKFIVIHYTGMQSKRVSIQRLISKKHKVSCHYLIDRSGKIIQMVDENKIAWHAGKSKWKNFINLNNSSLGIELVNRGHRLGYQSFSKSQIKQLVKFCLQLKKKYKIKKSNILGHSDIAPLRKIDPGEKFPWFKLEKKGLGIWYKIKQNHHLKKKLNKQKIRSEFFQNLHKFGYRYFSKKNPKKTDKLIVKSFQSRFRQSKINGLIDLECLKISQNLARNSKI